MNPFAGWRTWRSSPAAHPVLQGRWLARKVRLCCRPRKPRVPRAARRTDDRARRQIDEVVMLGCAGPDAARGQRRPRRGAALRPARDDAGGDRDAQLRVGHGSACSRPRCRSCAPAKARSSSSAAPSRCRNFPLMIQRQAPSAVLPTPRQGAVVAADALATMARFRPSALKPRIAVLEGLRTRSPA